MVLCVKVKLEDAQAMREYLKENELFLEGYRYGKDKSYLYFPVKEKFDGSKFVEYEALETPQRQQLKDLLAEKLSGEEIHLVRSAHDSVGSIAIMEIPPELESKEKLIGETLLSLNKNITTVLKKVGGHEGELRLQQYQCIAGEDTRETVVIENGVRLKIDVEAVYYSVRTATERKRVAMQVKSGERVLVMFSGAAPYPCVISKLSEASEIVGVELNERGHELGILNVEMNKLSNVVLIQGDVREVVPELKEKGAVFDRIVMPLPHTGSDFLDVAFSVAKKGTVIHMYDFENEGAFELAAKKVQDAANREGVGVEIKDIVACGQHSPRFFRVCVDFEVLLKP